MLLSVSEVVEIFSRHGMTFTYTIYILARRVTLFIFWSVYVLTIGFDSSLSTGGHVFCALLFSSKPNPPSPQLSILISFYNDVSQPFLEGLSDSVINFRVVFGFFHSL